MVLLPADQRRRAWGGQAMLVLLTEPLVVPFPEHCLVAVSLSPNTQYMAAEV